jgi:hypothetical protein
MDKDLGVLYKATDPQGHCYIGQHAGDGSDIGITYFGSGVKIKAAIKEHGKDFFTYWIFAKKLTQGDRNNGERYYIKFFQARINGYNSNDGGSGSFGYKHTKESKEKLSKATLGRKDSDETKKRKSESGKIAQNRPEVKAEKARIARITNSRPEVKEKIGAALRGKKNKPLSDEHKTSISKSGKIAQNKPETKAKKSKSAKVFWAGLSEEEKTNRGKKLSEVQIIAQNRPETSKKRSESGKISQNRPEVTLKKQETWANKSDEEKRTIGNYGRHIRWDVNRGIINPNCKFCMEEGQ